MSKPQRDRVQLAQLPLLIRIGVAEKLFGISRYRLMQMVKEGAVHTIRLSERGQHRFPVFELASALGMADQVPRVAVPVSKDFVRNLENEVRDTINKAQSAFRHELRIEMDQLRKDMREMINETLETRHLKPHPVRPAVRKKGPDPVVGDGGSY